MKWMTLKEVAAVNGISYAALLYRVNEKHLYVREAIALPYVKSPRGPGTVRQRARAAGKSTTTVRRAMGRGMTLEQALAYEPQKGFKVRA